MKLVKVAFGVLFMCGLFVSLYSYSQIKVICNNDEEVYVDNKFKADCNSGESIPILVKPGKHIVEVKTIPDNSGTYFCYKKIYSVKNNTNRVVEPNMATCYTEEYYYKKAKYTKKIHNYWNYLKKYPNGKYAKEIISLIGHPLEKTFGGNNIDSPRSIIQTKDGGYIVVGRTDSKGAGKADIWIIKLDKYLNRIWDKTFGGADYDYVSSIIQTEDDGFMLVGETYSKSVGKNDAWIIKIDRDGNKVWDETFGGKKWDTATSIAKTKDGSYIVAGYRTNGKKYDDAWIIKIDNKGKKKWSKFYGGNGNDKIHSIIPTTDGKFILVGKFDSNDEKGDDVWIIKIDKNGNKVWDKMFGGKGSDEAYSALQTNDGDFIIVGKTGSKGAGGSDAWVIKIDKNGKKVWDKTIGGKYGDSANSIIHSRDNTYIITGETSSQGKGRTDIWIIKIDKKGNKIWDDTFGGDDWDKGIKTLQTKDGGFIIVGDTQSKGKGEHDIWLIKLDHLP